MEAIARFWQRTQINNIDTLNMNIATKIPERSEVPVEDTWDLTQLYETDALWEAAFEDFEKQIPKYEEYRGKLGESPAVLAELLAFDSDLDKIGERLGSYAFLQMSGDQANPDYQRMTGRFQNMMAKAGEASSYIRPELLSIDDAKMQQFMDDPVLELYKLSLERLLRYKPHTLGDKEESLLAMQAEMAGTASATFQQLHNSDMKFGLIKDENGDEAELSHSTLMKYLESPSRDVRKNAFHQYYEQFIGHENTFASMLNGSMQKDAYYANVRGYGSALEKALFADDVPMSVYDNLIASVRDNLSAVHKYFDLRRKTMELPDIHHYDTYVPILSDIDCKHTWEEATDVILESLSPLGEEYTSALGEGLRGRWCDRYPNQGKRAGAFSAGGFFGPPYILMNYKPEVLSDVFTLAHEAGHSMHTYNSVRHQPYEYYSYTIFVAEVASTFNEQLLAHHLLKTNDDPRMRAYLINNEIDSIRGTIVRQTMFAEFEKNAHAMVESGEPLTVQSAKAIYSELLQVYFGPDFAIDEELSLECLRIPHFYRAFYVYKYATGLSAAIALSQKVLNGGQEDLDRYLSFLRGGCSKYPLELLRDAGVDMESPEPVNMALNRFGELVEELEQLLKEC